jgi:hypothetical protein
MTLRVFHTLAQLLAAAAMTCGVFLLFGVPWALTVGGFAVLVGSVVAEASAPRKGGA